MTLLDSPRLRHLARRIRITCLVLAGGILPLQASCGRLLEDSISAGLGQAISSTTAGLFISMLSTTLEIDIDSGSFPDLSGAVGSDPFAPPIQR